MKRTKPKQTPRKKAYAAPRLTRFGKFKEIVQGVGGNKNEPHGMDRSRT